MSCLTRETMASAFSFIVPYKILHMSENGFCEYCGSVFSGSAWNLRYAQGGTSGSGSYGVLGVYKASMIDQFILHYKIQSIIDFGCGNGHQLLMFKELPSYIGLDISSVALAECKHIFMNDIDKSFYLYEPGSFEIYLLLE